MTDAEFVKTLEAVSMEETEAWLQDLIDRKIIMIDADGKLIVEGGD